MSFLNWQLKHILFEEEWVFPVSGSAPALRDRLEQKSRAMDEKFRIFVEYDYNNDVYLIRSFASKVMSSILFANYYFVGEIKHKDEYVYMYGEYRSNSSRRWLSLFGINIIFIMIFFVLISPFTIIADVMDLSKLKPEDMLVFGMLYLAIFAFFPAIYLFAFLWSKIEKMGRDNVYNFLVDITSDSD